MDYKSEALIREMLLGACPEDQFFGEESGGPTRPGALDRGPHRRHRQLHARAAAVHDLHRLRARRRAADRLRLLPRHRRAVPGGAGPGRDAERPADPCLRHALEGRHRPPGLRPPHPENRERTLAVFPALLRSVSDVRRTGSAAYDLCCVASGRADAFLELGINLYDYGAGYVILTEAGGTVHRLAGRRGRPGQRQSAGDQRRDPLARIPRVCPTTYTIPIRIALNLHRGGIPAPALPKLRDPHARKISSAKSAGRFGPPRPSGTRPTGTGPRRGRSPGP